MIEFNKHFIEKQFSVSLDRLWSKGWQSIAILFCLTFSLSLAMSSLKIMRGVSAEDLNISTSNQLFSVTFETKNSTDVDYRYIREFSRQQNIFRQLSFFTFAQGEVKFHNQSSESYTIGIAEPSFWSTLNILPYLGQWPQDSHDIVISYPFWKSKFSKNPKIIGQSLEINNITYRVCAVLDQSFVTPPYKMIQALETANGKTAIWLPLNDSNNLGSYEYLGIGSSIAPQRELQLDVDTRFDLKEDDKYPINIKVVSFLDKVNESTLWLRVFYISATTIFSIVVLTALFNILLSNTMSYRANTALRLMLGGSLLQVYIIDFFELLVLFFVALLVAMPFSFLLQSFVDSYSLFSFGAISVLPDFFSFFIIVLIGLSALSALAFFPHLMIPHDRLMNEQSSGSKGGNNRKSGLQYIFFNMQLSVSLILICFSIFFIGNKSQQVENFLSNKISNVMAIQLEHKNVSLGSDEIAKLYTDILKHAEFLGYQAALSTSSPLDLAGNSVVMTSAEAETISFHTVSISKQYFDILENEFLEGQTFANLFPTNNDIVISDSLSQLLQSSSVQTLASFESYGHGNILGVVSESRVANPIISNFIRHQDGIVYSLYNEHTKSSSADKMHLIIAKNSLSAHEINDLFRPFRSKVNIRTVVSLEEEQRHRMNSVFIGLSFCGILLLSGLTITIISCWSMVQFSCKLRQSEFGLKLALGAPPFRIIMEYMKSMVVSILWSLTFTLVCIGIGIYFIKTMLPGYGSLALDWMILTCFVFVLAILISSVLPLYRYIYQNNPMNSLREN